MQERLFNKAQHRMPVAACFDSAPHSNNNLSILLGYFSIFRAKHFDTPASILVIALIILMLSIFSP
jgi:hypothetical protein